MSPTDSTYADRAPDPTPYLVRDGIHVGYTCQHEPFEKMYLERTGSDRKFDPRIFNMSPCGSRMLIVREEAAETVGTSNLIVPKIVQERNPPGAGYIVAVGDMVGRGTAPHPHGVRCNEPSELLYRRIIFGMYSGNEFVTQPYKDGGFATKYWIMTDRDVWFIDWGFGGTEKAEAINELKGIQQGLSDAMQQMKP